MTPLLLLLFAATSVHCQAITEVDHIDAFVDMHNRLRRSVVPQAANMGFVDWSPTLATYAASAECGYPDIAFTQHPGNGRNYFRDTTRENDIDKVGEIIATSVSKWFSDKRVYIYESNTCPSGTKENCDAFRLFISPALSEIGCAVKKDCNTTGYHQYLCLYDTQVTASSTPIYKAGAFGSGCAGTGNATEASGYSFYGLCLMSAHRITNQLRHIIAAECLITCKNCATGQRKDEVRDAGICRCPSCLSGYSGADCSITNNSATALDCGGLCNQQGTPCQNGIDKSANGKCICDCEDSWAGTQCEIHNDDYNNAVYLELTNFISNDPLPVDPRPSESILSAIKTAVAAATNAFCVSSNITNVAKCCEVTRPKAAPTDPFLNKDCMTSSLESGLTPNGNYGVAIVVKLHHSNNMCESKPNHNFTSLPLEVLVESLNTAGFATALTKELSYRSCGKSPCLKLVADSIRSYKGFADDKYGIRTLDSITTKTVSQPDDNKDTTTTTTAAAAGPSTTTAGVFLALLLIILLLLLAAG